MRWRSAAREIASVADQLIHQSALREADELEEATYDLIDSEPEDQVAASALRDAIAMKSRRAVRFWRGRLPSAETSQTDRVCRIAVAAIRDEPVKPVDPAQVELLSRLREMNSLPIGEAYQLLADLVPELRSVEAKLPALPADNLAQARWASGLSLALIPVVGHDANHHDPLVRTGAMHGLARQYLQIAAGETSLGSTAMSCNEIGRRRAEKLQHEGWNVEHRSGGRAVFSSKTTFRMPWAKGEPGSSEDPNTGH